VTAIAAPAMRLARLSISTNSRMLAFTLTVPTMALARFRVKDFGVLVERSAAPGENAVKTPVNESH
jgi:hypothetical protein